MLTRSLARDDGVHELDEDMGGSPNRAMPPLALTGRRTHARAHAHTHTHAAHTVRETQR